MQGPPSSQLSFLLETYFVNVLVSVLGTIDGRLEPCSTPAGADEFRLFGGPWLDCLESKGDSSSSSCIVCDCDLAALTPSVWSSSCACSDISSWPSLVSSPWLWSQSTTWLGMKWCSTDDKTLIPMTPARNRPIRRYDAARGEYPPSFK